MIAENGAAAAPFASEDAMSNPQSDAAREILSRLIAACYYQPGPEFAEERVFDAISEAATAIDPGLGAIAERLGPAFAAVTPDELLLDYTRLFLGPNEILAKPYGSVWLTGEKSLMQDATMAVLELYRDGGFELAEDFRELPDHIAAELEFLYLLIFRENRAREDGDSAALAAVGLLRRRFLAEHLGAWIGRFGAAMQNGAETAFYRLLSELTVAFVNNESAAC
jgi:TorA maturation chaperone TorD